MVLLLWVDKAASISFKLLNENPSEEYLPMSYSHTVSKPPKQHRQIITAVSFLPESDDKRFSLKVSH